MILMTELSESVSAITEEVDGNKNLYITGVFAQSDIPNRNGRTYPKMYMESALNKFSKLVEAKRACGELNHSNKPGIDLDRVSHLIESLEHRGNDVIGKAKILNTPMGNIARNLIEGGVQLGVSTRGLGSLKRLPSGINEVQSDFMLNTIDIVSDPSGIDCFVNGILENVEYFVTDDGRIQEATKKKIKKNSLSEEQKVQLFQQFIYEITNYG
jgi:hypothetical protein